VQVDNPVPAAYSALGLALPAVLLAGRALARTLGLPRALSLILTPGLALALWLLATHTVAYAMASFPPGLAIGTFLVAASGLAAAFGEPLSRDRESRTSSSPSRQGALPSWWVLVGAVLAAGSITPMALRWAFHDEVTIAGHLALGSAIQNGAFPPRYPTFPKLELRYHYGFDTVLAAVSAVTRLRIDHAADLVTIVAWAYAFVVLWALGDPTLRRPRGAATAGLVLYGGGVPWFCDGPVPTWVHRAVFRCDVDETWVNPPIASYFFQHPWTLGLPLGVCLLLVLLHAPRSGAPRLLTLALLLVALALTQIVLFYALAAVGIATLAVQGAANRARLPRLSATCALEGATSVLLALLVATQLGGFFAHGPDGVASGLEQHFGVVETWQGNLCWHVATFGVALPLGLTGLLVPSRRRLPLALLVLGGLLIPNVLRFRLSWDIVKFSVLAAIALGALFADFAVALFESGPAWLGGPLGVVVLLAGMAPGLGFAGVFGINHPDIPEAYFARHPVFLSTPESQAASWLRRHVSPGEIVYSSREAARGYAAWGGIPGPWVEKDTKAFGFSEEQLAAREALTARLPDTPDRYLAEGIRWFAVGPLKTRAYRLTTAWIARGRARAVAEWDGLRVVELLAAPEGPTGDELAETEPGEEDEQESVAAMD
jgi:hypothetical protein